MSVIGSYVVSVVMTPILTKEQHDKVDWSGHRDLEVVHHDVARVDFRIRSGGVVGAEAVAVNYATCRWFEAATRSYHATEVEVVKE